MQHYFIFSFFYLAAVFLFQSSLLVKTSAVPSNVGINCFISCNVFEGTTWSKTFQLIKDDFPNELTTEISKIPSEIEDELNFVTNTILKSYCSKENTFQNGTSILCSKNNSDYQVILKKLIFWMPEVQEILNSVSEILKKVKKNSMKELMDGLFEGKSSEIQLKFEQFLFKLLSDAMSVDYFYCRLIIVLYSEDMSSTQKILLAFGEIISDLRKDEGYFADDDFEICMDFQREKTKKKE